MRSKPFLRDHVKHAVQGYLENLQGESTSHMYDLVINEVESALLETIMSHVKGNQSKASEFLGLNRGTLRKLLVKYGID